MRSYPGPTCSFCRHPFRKWCNLRKHITHLRLLQLHLWRPSPCPLSIRRSTPPASLCLRFVGLPGAHAPGLCPEACGPAVSLPYCCCCCCCCCLVHPECRPPCTPLFSLRGWAPYTWPYSLSYTPQKALCCTSSGVEPTIRAALSPSSGSTTWCYAPSTRSWQHPPPGLSPPDPVLLLTDFDSFTLLLWSFSIAAK